MKWIVTLLLALTIISACTPAPRDPIIYTTDMGVDVEPLKQDCASHGGTFNECGSSCPPGVELCVAVCAYTCEFS